MKLYIEVPILNLIFFFNFKRKSLYYHACNAQYFILYSYVCTIKKFSLIQQSRKRKKKNKTLRYNYNKKNDAILPTTKKKINKIIPSLKYEHENMFLFY